MEAVGANVESGNDDGICHRKTLVGRRITARGASVGSDGHIQPATLGDAPALTLRAAAPHAVVDVFGECVLEARLRDWTGGTYRSGAVDACTI